MTGAADPPPAGLEPPDPDDIDGQLDQVLADLATIGDPDARLRRVHEVIADLAFSATRAVEQRWRHRIVDAGHIRAGDWREVYRDARQRADAARESDERDQSTPPPQSQAELLAAMAAAGWTFHRTDEGEPIALPAGDGPRVAISLRGSRSSLRAELAAGYLRRHGRPPSSNALADVLAALEGQCLLADPIPVDLRVARQDGITWLDLGRADGQAIRISPHGWKPTAEYPVTFRRTRLVGELPEPVPGGDLHQLRHLLGIPTSVWPALVAWLVAALIPDIPHPVLALTGEHGSAKSTRTRMLVRVLDPSPAPLRTAPRDVESWAVAASASWMVALDNITRIEPWLSDALCRAVTGDGLVRRELYTSTDVSILAFRRVIALNGIELEGMRGDLADRLLRVELDRIGDHSRRQDADVEREWHAAHPHILGGLLDLAVQVLAQAPHVRLDSYPRMADYARILATVDHILGTNGLAEYLDQRRSLASEQVEYDPVAAAIRKLVDNVGQWQGTAGELLQELTPEHSPKSWPTTPHAMTARLKRAAPALRGAAGIDVDRLGPTGKTRARLWQIKFAAGETSATSERPPPTQTSWSHDRTGADVPADVRADVSPPAAQTSAKRPPVSAAQNVENGADVSPAANLTAPCPVCREPLDPAAGTVHPACDQHAEPAIT